VRGYSYLRPGEREENERFFAPYPREGRGEEKRLLSFSSRKGRFFCLSAVPEGGKISKLSRFGRGGKRGESEALPSSSLTL